MGWKLVLLGKSGVPAGRGLKTSIKPIGFLGVLRYKSLISGDFHVESWFSWNSCENDEFSCFMWKSRKSWIRTPGWISREAVKVLCFIRFWERYLRPGAEFSQITHFLWKWVEFHHISWKWGDFTQFSAPWGGNGARAAPGWKHQRNLSFSCAFLGVPGTEKCVSGWIFTKISVSGAFLVKITKMGGIPRNYTIFTKFPGFGRSRRPGPPKGHGICMYYKGFCKVRRGQG